MLIRILLAFVLFGCSVSSAKTRGFVEVGTSFPDAKAGVNINVGITHMITKYFGLSGFVLVKGGWAQGYVGPEISPIKSLSFSIASGINQGNDRVPQVRFAFVLFSKVNYFSLLSIFEFSHDLFFGVDSVWYDVEFRVHPIKWFTAGLKFRRYLGFGPIIKFNWWKLQLWLSWNPVDFE